MRRLLVLGAGTAGTMAVNRLRPRLAADEWNITVVDPSHPLLPARVPVPAVRDLPARGGAAAAAAVVTDGVTLVTAEIDRVVPDENKVLLTDGADWPTTTW